MKHGSWCVLLVASAVATAACSDRLAGPSTDDEFEIRPGVSSDRNGRPAAAQFEVPYMRFTIDHHAMGIMMASLCTEKAVHEQLRNLCERNARAQTRELAQLQSWLQEWYGITYEPRLTPADMRMHEKLAQLGPRAFEIEFMSMFSRHHLQIIRRSVPIAREAKHEPLERMAEQIIAAQSQDVRDMHSWLCSWYAICRPVPPLPQVD